jgi:hypothetical protein
VVDAHRTRLRKYEQWASARKKCCQAFGYTRGADYLMAVINNINKHIFFLLLRASVLRKRRKTISLSLHMAGG